MFCPHCGAQHSGVGTFCVTCGKQGNPIAQVNAKIYPHCPHCGNPGVVDRFMIGRSVTCPRCNSIFIVTDPAPQANQQMPSAQYINIQMNAQPGIAYNPKDKTTAILLAIFLGIFAWLYTYRCDSWKFWLSIGLTIVTCGLFGIAAYVWVIIDACTRSEEFYQFFPI